MAPIVNGRVIFNEIPREFPEPGRTLVYDTSEKLDPDTVPLDGGVLIKTLDLSIDPYMRSRMREPHVKSYLPAYELGKPIDGLGIGKVIRSDNPMYKRDDIVHGMIAYAHFSIYKGAAGYPNLQLRILEGLPKLPWSTYLGVLGMPGQTAYFAWKEFSSAKKGERAFVSTGAGPVGSLVIQLAKRDGVRTIGSAGSDEKVQFMKEIGTDVAFNYKTTNTLEVLQKEGGIDIYWDNVGGQTLDNALEAAHFRGRFIECGMISGYNTGNNTPITNLMQVVSKSLTLYGFIVIHLAPKYEKEFYEVLPPLVASGEIKYREEITPGLENVGNVILSVQKGLNKAKAVVHVADD